MKLKIKESVLDYQEKIKKGGNMLKKEREMREKILNRIEELLHAGSKLNEAEKKILMEYHERIEKSKNMEFELVHLRNALLPLVISSQLSPDVLKFYKELRSERKVTWGEGSSLLTGIALFPEKNERKHL